MHMEILWKWIWAGAEARDGLIISSNDGCISWMFNQETLSKFNYKKVLYQWIYKLYFLIFGDFSWTLRSYTKLHFFVIIISVSINADDIFLVAP